MYSTIDDAWNNNVGKISTKILDKNNESASNESYDSQLNLSDSITMCTPNTCDINYPLTTKKNGKKSTAGDICKDVRQHLHDCIDCNIYLQNMVDKQAEQIVNNMILKKKIKQLDSLEKKQSSKFAGLSTNELLIIVISIIALMLFVYLISRK